MSLEKLKDLESEFLHSYPKGFKDEYFFPRMKNEVTGMKTLNHSLISRRLNRNEPEAYINIMLVHYRTKGLDLRLYGIT